MMNWEKGCVTLAADELREHIKGRKVALMMNTTAIDNNSNLLVDVIAREA